MTDTLAAQLRDDWYDYVRANEGWTTVGDDGIDYAIAWMREHLGGNQ